MDIKVFDFEISPKSLIDNKMNNYDINIDDKYENGYSRVVTENGSCKVAFIKDTFNNKNYNLHPEYQRRIRWSEQKRSKLIVSLIINIPIPPIFLYEYDFDKYEVMDGLQRLSAIIDYYDNKYKLSGLVEWGELNGKYYDDLPEKIKEGIGRRQIQTITLLKESANNPNSADRIKRLVFERLNTGGITLNGQEIRNALYAGHGNRMCIELSKNKLFQKLWGIIEVDENLIYDNQEFDEYDIVLKNMLYKRMGDVELVLRFFSMRFINDFNTSLDLFLDNTLINLNRYSKDELKQLEKLFYKTIDNAYNLFGDKAFCFYKDNKWGNPTRMIYDPMMQVLSQFNINKNSIDIQNNINKLADFYNKEIVLFDGKRQSKENIKNRINAINDFINNNI